MPGRKNVLVSILSIFLLLSLVFVLWPSPALATSGIGVKYGIMMVIGDGNPPPNQTRVTIYAFVIRNTNDVCNEDVKINGVVINDPLSEGDGLAKKGYAKLLGFKRDLGEGYSPELEFELEDETDATIYFGVETGEDSNGCDFRAFKAIVTICDTGPICFTCCDWWDPPCEDPTPEVLELIQNAAQVSPPTGSGVIYGKVTDSADKGLRARMRVLKVGSCVPGDPDNAVIYDSDAHAAIWTEGWPDRGEYRVESLPYGNYKVTARKDGVTQTKDVAISSGTPTAEVNFVF